MKLLDFGIAKVLADSGVTMQQLTATGEAIGSPLYMSPEQGRGMKVDNRADIYSLGCVMHECFAGYPPFKGANAMATIQMHLNDPPAPLSGLCRSEQELQIASLIHKCILKNPDDRFQSAGELADHLAEIANVGTQVKAIQRPSPGMPQGMGNRWKKGGKAVTDQMQQPSGPEGPLKSSGLHQAIRPSGSQSSGMHPAITPEQFAHPGGLAAAGGLGSTLRRPTAEIPTGSPATQAMESYGSNGATQSMNTSISPGVDLGLTKEAASERWHMHNVVGQQKMSERSHFEAEMHFQKAIQFAEQYFDHSDSRLPKTMNNFANCLKVQGRYEEAERIYQQALQTKENQVGPVHKDLILFLENYANLLRICKREQEAVKFDKRIQVILKQS